MKLNIRQYLPIGIAILMPLILELPAVAFASGEGAKLVTPTPSSDLTPLPGNPVRKAVLDSLRNEVKRIHGLDVAFVVKHLKVRGGWAWVHALPQSADGKSRYEDIVALLTLRDGAWEIAEIPCAEVDNPDCMDAPEYFEGLMKRFPAVPIQILPITN